MELKEIDMKAIVRNPRQPRKSFDHEKIVELANSIKEGELLQPIVVSRLKDSKFGLVCGERRFRAYEYLKRKTIPALIRDFKDSIDALEKSAIENWHREDLTDVEKRTVINELWSSGKYPSELEMSRKTGISQRVINDYIEESEFSTRAKNIPAEASHTLVRETRGLKDNVRKKLIKTAVKEGITATEVRERIVPTLKQIEDPKVQSEALDRIVKRRNISKEYEEREAETDVKIAKGERDPELKTYHETDGDKRHLDELHHLWDELITTARAEYITWIKNEKVKRDAIKILWDIHNFTLKQLQELGESKVIEHGTKKT